MTFLIHWLYNFISTILLLIFTPILVPLLLARKKYRGRISRRLGIGLGRELSDLPDRAAVFWLHALSVGEVTSALPLVQGLRTTYPDATIVFSTATKTGMQVARSQLAPLADAIIYGPVDLLPVVKRFITVIAPDLFLLVETDFWPNWLYQLEKKGVPSLLVNGRISVQSHTSYRCFAFFFRPMFSRFQFLAMQTAQDKAYLEQLGIESDRIAVLGNLKYRGTMVETTTQPGALLTKKKLHFPPHAHLWICGSTHQGEEEIILDTYGLIRRSMPALFLMIAPRNTERSDAVVGLATARGFTCQKRSSLIGSTTEIVVLDTIGELSASYRLADVSFIGGSLVAAGGHNPIESAVHGVPAFWGPHMEDFQEIADELQACGGGKKITSGSMLAVEILHILSDAASHHKASEAAKKCVHRHHDVVTAHLDVINQLLQSDCQ